MLQIFVHFAKRSKIFFGINNNYFGGKQHACADLTSVQNWFASAGWAATLSDQRQEEKAMRVTGAPSAAYTCGLVCAMGAVAARQWGGSGSLKKERERVNNVCDADERWASMGILRYWRSSKKVLSVTALSQVVWDC